MLSKTQIELLDANIERLQKLSHDVTVMYDNGFTEKVDIDKLTVQTANLQTEKLKAQNITNCSRKKLTKQKYKFIILLQLSSHLQHWLQ